MSLGRLRGMKVKTFTATILVPLTPTPDGTSLEEKINTWIETSEGENANLIEIQYQAEGANYTALLLYSK